MDTQPVVFTSKAKLSKALVTDIDMKTFTMRSGGIKSLVFNVLIHYISGYKVDSIFNVLINTPISGLLALKSKFDQ
jgi:hypothetical protein